MSLCARHQTLVQFTVYRTKYPNSGGSVNEVNSLFVIEKYCIPDCFRQHIYGSWETAAGPGMEKALP